MTDPHDPSSTAPAPPEERTAPEPPLRQPPPRPEPPVRQPPPRPEPPANERDRLVAGAWNVLARSGFAGFKVQLVLRDAHVSARSFYRHFASKDELLLTLLGDEMRRGGVVLTAAVASAPDPVAQVVAWVTTVLRIVEHPRLAPRARLFSEQQSVMHRYPAEVAAATRPLLDPLEAAISQGRHAGTFSHAHPANDALMIYLLTGSVQTRNLDSPREVPLDEVISSTVDFVLRALRSPGAPTRGGTAPRTPPG